MSQILAVVGICQIYGGQGGWGRVSDFIGRHTGGEIMTFSSIVRTVESPVREATKKNWYLFRNIDMPLPYSSHTWPSTSWSPMWSHTGHRLQLHLNTIGLLPSEGESKSVTRLWHYHGW